MPPKHHGGHGGGGHGGGQHQGQHSSGTSYGGGGGSGGGFDLSSVEQFAQQHAGSSGDSSMFSSALGMISGKSSQLQNEDVDENHMVNAHQSFFGGGSTGGEATSGGIGAASAMQALKMFGSGSGGSSSSSSGGGMQQQFMGMAMGQASKLFDQQQASGNVASGESKQSAVQSAGEYAMKMYMKSEMGGSSGGGLMSLASKFM